MTRKLIWYPAITVLATIIAGNGALHSQEMPAIKARDKPLDPRIEGGEMKSLTVMLVGLLIGSLCLGKEVHAESEIVVTGRGSSSIMPDWAKIEFAINLSKDVLLSLLVHLREDLILEHHLYQAN